MSRESRESFVFYSSFQKAIDKLNSEDQLMIYRSIVCYSLYAQEPQLEGVCDIVWQLVKPQLDANWRKYKKGCQGGAPKGTRNNPNGRGGRTNQELTKNKPNDNVNVNDNVNDNDNVVGEINNKPLLSEIVEFIESNNLQVDATHFFDYYTSNGWRLGRNPMIDWRAALRNWDRNPSVNQTLATQQIVINNDL